MLESDVAVVSGYIRVSSQLAAEMSAEFAAWRVACDEEFRLAAIGPVHGPPLPRRLAVRRGLAEFCPGRPFGRFRR